MPNQNDFWQNYFINKTDFLTIVAFLTFVALIVPSRYFCGGSFCFMSWCLKYFCAVGALCMFSYI